MYSFFAICQGKVLHFLQMGLEMRLAVTEAKNILENNYHDWQDRPEQQLLWSLPVAAILCIGFTEACFGGIPFPEWSIVNVPQILQV